MSKFIFSFLFFMFSFLFALGDIDREEYVMLVNDSEIYAKPSLNSIEIGIAKKNSIFLKWEVVGEWTGLIMFSGDLRYTKSKNVNFVGFTEYDWEKHKETKRTFSTKLPSLENIPLAKIKLILSDLGEIEDKSADAAAKKYPSDFTKQIDYSRILVDIDKLKYFQKEKLNPFIYNKSKVNLITFLRKFDK